MRRPPVDVGDFFATPARRDDRAVYVFVFAALVIVAVGARDGEREALAHRRAKLAATASKRPLHAPEMLPMEAP